MGVKNGGLKMQCLRLTVFQYHKTKTQGIKKQKQNKKNTPCRVVKLISMLADESVFFGYI